MDSQLEPLSSSFYNPFCPSWFTLILEVTLCVVCMCVCERESLPSVSCHSRAGARTNQLEGPLISIGGHVFSWDLQFLTRCNSRKHRKLVSFKFGEAYDFSYHLYQSACQLWFSNALFHETVSFDF